MSVAVQSALTRGVVFIHSTPASLCPHIGWALENVLGVSTRLAWTPQPLGRKLVRTQAAWTGTPGTGAQLASALRICKEVRYEVVEEPSPGVDGARWCFTPSLGMHHAVVSVNGDCLVSENRLRSALGLGDPGAVRRELEQALGTPWDAELEPFRHAGENAPVRWLHRVS